MLPTYNHTRGDSRLTPCPACKDIIDMSLSKITQDFIMEFNRARRKFAPMHSSHEGYAVLKEEVDELWAEVKRNSKGNVLRKEAVQVGAMALAFILEVCGDER